MLALAHAHGFSVFHADLKPDNIMLDVGSGRPMVTDFGIARAISDGADARLTATGIAIGTPAYMSPEQSAGDKEVDGRADLYALGIVGGNRDPRRSGGDRHVLPRKGSRRSL